MQKTCSHWVVRWKFFTRWQVRCWNRFLQNGVTSVHRDTEKLQDSVICLEANPAWGSWLKWWLPHKVFLLFFGSCWSWPLLPGVLSAPFFSRWRILKVWKGWQKTLALKKELLKSECGFVNLLFLFESLQRICFYFLVVSLLTHVLLRTTQDKLCIELCSYASQASSYLPVQQELNKQPSPHKNKEAFQ